MRLRIGLILMVLVGGIGIVTQSSPASAGRTALPEGFTRVEFANNLLDPTDFAFQGSRSFVAERAGVIRLVKPNGQVRSKPYATLHVSLQAERGLLGIAVDPAYSKNKFIYVYYTTGPGSKQYSGTPQNRVSRLTTKQGVGTNEKIILDNIPSDTGSHDGGALFFGFDKKLYVGVGDNGIELDRVTDLSKLHGKILRINRRGSVPPDNPFVNTPGADPRIYAYGVRNPFRAGSRPANGTILFGDVGENTWEELNTLTAGADYGWYRYEGPCPFAAPECDPAATDFGTTTPPVHYYHHVTGTEWGRTIIPGAFPNPSNYPAPYNNALFYGDWARNWVHVLLLDDTNQVTARLDFDTLDMPVSFKTGPDGNIYVLTMIPGKIFKYVYTAP